MSEVILYHVTSAWNRESIRRDGLDWTRMGAAPGIAGSTNPEEEGIFLCRDEYEATLFTQMNNTGTPADVWQVSGVDMSRLLDNGQGYLYYPNRIPAGQVSLFREDVIGSMRDVWGPPRNSRKKKRTREH
jgi:hypothetical protein